MNARRWILLLIPVVLLLLVLYMIVSIATAPRP